MKEELGTPGAVVGAVVLACLFGGLTLAIYPGWNAVGSYLPAFPGWPDLIAAISAFGTCAAVVVVLWQANRQSREERYRRLEIANLHAAGMAASLKNAHDHLGLAHFLLWAGTTSQNKKRAVIQACDMLRAQLKRPSLDELTALTPLPNHCSQRIARAFDILEVVRHKATMFNGTDSELHPPEKTQELLRHAWGDDLQRALDHLQMAMQECAKAADIGAPLPTHLELHGDSLDWEE